MCNESYKQNEVTKEDVYHLLRIEKMLDALKSSKYFSVLDLCHGFNNVPVKEYDKKRLPFPFLEGITNIIICRTDCLTALSEYCKTRVFCT